MEKSIKDHETYNEAYNVAIDWLKDKRNAIQNVHSHGTKDQVLERQKKLSAISNGLIEGDGVVENVVKVSVAVIESTGDTGVDKIKIDVQQLETELKEIKNTVADTEDLLARCVASWDNFMTVLNALKNWENATSLKVRKAK